MTRQSTLREMLAAMAHLPDDTVFRWYQVSEAGPLLGSHIAGDSLFVTLGQVRLELSGNYNRKEHQ